MSREARGKSSTFDVHFFRRSHTGRQLTIHDVGSRCKNSKGCPAIPQPRGRTGSNAVEAWRWQHCSGEGKFVMSVFDRREARIQEFGDTTAAGLCREADWNFGGPTVGKAEGRITVIGRMG